MAFNQRTLENYYNKYQFYKGKAEEYKEKYIHGVADYINVCEKPPRTQDEFENEYNMTEPELQQLMSVAEVAEQESKKRKQQEIVDLTQEMESGDEDDDEVELLSTYLRRLPRKKRPSLQIIYGTQN